MMFRPLMSKQLVTPIEALLSIAITGPLETFESALAREVAFEVALQICVTLERLCAVPIGAEESRMNDGVREIVFCPRAPGKI